jgi:hypothetical protein
MVVNELTRGGREQGQASDVEVDRFLRRFKRGLV